MTQERFIELSTAEQEPLRRFLLALCCGDRYESEEIAQETLIKAWLASDDYAERCKFRTWLFTIAYRTFIDHTRRPQRPAVPPDECIPAGDTADSTFRYEALYHAIDLLPERIRAATLLYHIEGYSV